MEKAEAKYAQELKKFIPTMEKMFQRLEADLKEEGYDWSSHKKTKIAHIKQTYKKDYGPETACFKASAQLPFDPEFILDNIVLNTESIKKWSSVQSTKTVDMMQHTDFDLELYHQVVHGALLGGVSPRDFCLCRAWKRGKGVTMMVCCSVEDERIPVTEEFVRGHVYNTAFYSKQSETDAKISDCHYIIQTNIKGSLPYWMVSKGVASEICESFDKIIKAHS